MKTTIGGKNMRKKAISITLCIVICMSMMPLTGYAQVRVTTFEEMLANDLKTLGLFRGVSDTDFDLNRAPSRVEALVMLIRVLGKESEALSSSNSHPFTDVAGWADPYVGYAYANNLTNGISDTQFGTGRASAAMYLTFVLRALDYDDTNGADFTWNDPFTLATTVGILPDFVNISTFWRADVVVISYASLAVTMKNSSQTLAQKLIAADVFTLNLYNATYDPNAIPNYIPIIYDGLSAEQIYEICSPAVFFIEVFNANGTPFGTGSGFFIESNGIAITNYHVIEGAHSAQITISSTSAVYDVTGVYDYNELEDWAVIKVDGSGFHTLKIGDASTVIGASTVYAIGSPLGLQNTISQGIISNTNRMEDGIRFIQTTAAISPGSSGGALINTLGEVIGITTAQYVLGQNLNLALPISYTAGHSRNNMVSLSVLFPNMGGSGDISSSIEMAGNGDIVRINGVTVYKFSPNQSGYWVFRTSHNDDNDPVLSLYDSNGREIAYDDDGDGNYNAVICTYLNSWESYYLEVSFYGYGTATCTLSVVPSIIIPSGGGTVGVSGDCVFTFTPSQSGTWTARTSSNDSADPVLLVYDENFRLIDAVDNDTYGYDEVLSMYFEAGKTYLIEVWFYQYNATGTLSLSM
ncbi:MAG: S1C family serine protease [Oscillospiraceae bacterium]|nr:S1C family serine protease [Oscillospiraceae bacterium]